MHLDQLETILVGTASLDRLTDIVQSERPNVAHQGSTGGNSLFDVKKCDLSSCPTIPLSESHGLKFKSSMLVARQPVSSILFSDFPLYKITLRMLLLGEKNSCTDFVQELSSI